MSQRTFLFLHVTQDLGFGCGADWLPFVPFVGGESVSWRLCEVLGAGPLSLLEVDRGSEGEIWVVWIGLVEKSVSC